MSSGCSAAGSGLKRSWMMPLLSSYISHTELGFFYQYFPPLAAKCREIALKQEAAGHKVLQKVFHTLATQIWDLFPSFCTKPTDLLQVITPPVASYSSGKLLDDIMEYNIRYRLWSVNARLLVLVFTFLLSNFCPTKPSLCLGHVIFWGLCLNYIHCISGLSSSDIQVMTTTKTKLVIERHTAPNTLLSP